MNFELLTFPCREMIKLSIYICYTENMAVKTQGNLCENEIHDRYNSPRPTSIGIGTTQSANSKQRRYSHIDVECRGDNINIDAYDARSCYTGHCRIHRDNGNM